MRVNGEAWFWLNTGLDLCALLLAARLMRVRVKTSRSVPAALLGGLYALAALFESRLSLLFLPVGLALSLLAFGRAGLRAFPGMLMGCLFLSGFLSLGIRREWPKAVILFACAAAAALSCLLLSRGKIAPGGGFTLRFIYRGVSCALPAFRDSGNALSDPVTLLPVLVVPWQGIRDLLPEGFDPGDLSTLPRGFRLLRVQTAASEKTLMCFHPDQVILQSGKRAVRIDAVAAVSAFSEKRALLPEALFEEDPFHQEAM